MDVLTEALTTDPSCDTGAKLVRADGVPVEWTIADGLVPYPAALEAMKARAAAIADGTAGEQVWLLEHPPLYTAGTSATADDLLTPNRFPVYDAGRGGQYTYHGPGQRVVYFMLDLRQRGRDVRCLVQGLEGLIIDTLAAFNIKGERREGRIGVWVQRPEKGLGREDKIAAIGVRVSRWVSFHGIAINVMPELDHFGGIVPCGIADQGVTSFEDLGQLVSMAEVDSCLAGRIRAALRGDGWHCTTGPCKRGVRHAFWDYDSVWIPIGDEAMTLDDLKKIFLSPTLFRLETILSPRLVPVLYATGLAALLLWSVGHLFASFGRNFGDGLWGLLEIAVYGALFLLFLRIVCEVLLVFFKSNEATTRAVSLSRVPSSLADEVRDAIHDIAEEAPDETSEGFTSPVGTSPRRTARRTPPVIPTDKPDI